MGERRRTASPSNTPPRRIKRKMRHRQTRVRVLASGPRQELRETPLLFIHPRREKVFGSGRNLPMDRNAKVRVAVFARTLARNHEITRAALDVALTLLWRFHNGKSGICFPSYETIAARAGCARSTVAVAIRALEQSHLLSWVNRITRIREQCRDLFGAEGWRWRVIRTSNAYAFIDPQQRASVPVSSKSDCRTGTPDQEVISLSAPPAIDPRSPLEGALQRLGATMAASCS